ncbi:MAG TPA: PKD domain-containing protein, partial [Aggregatilineales bacterium]|nr:PKD domain-containing protein [Aggregatilineales bacterium]
SVPVSKQVPVAAPTPEVQLPAVDFSFTADGQTVTFSNLTQGAVDSYFWDFGDGIGTSSDANPVYNYMETGTFTVNLTATNAAGSADISKDVTLQAQETLSDTTPVLPDLSPILPRLQQIYGQNAQRPSVFSVVGDQSVNGGDFLAPFANEGYQANVSGVDLTTVIEAYRNEIAVDEENSFAHVGAGNSASGTLNDFLNQPAPAPNCEGRTLLACELIRLTPATMFISIGYNDAAQFSDVNTFRANLGTLVDNITANGTIPVLMTIYDRAGSEDHVKALNDVIISVANEKQVPVFNVWRLFRSLPGQGLSGGAPSIAPEGANVLNDSTIAQYGGNARSYNALRLLDDLQTRVFRLR